MFCPSFFCPGRQCAPKCLCILRDHYGVGMEDALFEEDMKKLRSVLKCKNAGAVARKKGAPNGNDQNMESKQGGMGQKLQDGSDMADGSEEAKKVARRQVDLPVTLKR
jgi:hypothetical protein